MMSPEELKVIIGTLVAALGYFGVREFSRKDKLAADMDAFKASVDKVFRDTTETFARELRRVAERNTTAIDRLNQTVGNLTVTLAEQKTWFAEEYLRCTEHEKAIEELREHITREIKLHSSDCHSRKALHGKL